MIESGTMKPTAASGLSVALVAALLLAIPGCHTMRFDVSDEPHTEVVFDRKSFWVFGWFPNREVDVSRFCPDGVAAIREETRFSDGFFRLITIGIWTPRSSWYHCLAPAAQP